MRLLRTLALASLAALSGLSFARAATLSGQVKDANDVPQPNVKVAIPALSTAAVTDAQGNYKLENIPAGRYAVQFAAPDGTTITKPADLSAGDQTLPATLAASPLTLAPITITAAPEPSSILNTPASVTVLQGRDLEKSHATTVAGEVQDEPGVSMIAEGPTVVKPVIRGLNSSEIVVALNGMRQDFVQWGNEHAPEIDALSTNRIEVMRGPNSIIYGSDALGGVLSISQPDLPNAALGAGPLSGVLVADANSNNKEVGESATVQGASGDVAYRVNLMQRNSADWSNPNGVVPNTGEQEVGANAELGLRKDWGDVSLDYTHLYRYVQLQNPPVPDSNGPLPVTPAGSGCPLNNVYCSPAFPAPGAGGVAPTSLDLEYQQLYHDDATLHAHVNTDVARWEIITGWDQSNRNEYDGYGPDPTPADIAGVLNQPHLHWIESTYPLTVRANLQPMGPFQGTLGFDGLLRDEQDIGNVHLTPGYNETGLGEYLVEKVSVGKFDLSAGVRGDENYYHIDSDGSIGIDPDYSLNAPRPVAGQDRNYSAVTASLGGVYHITDPLSFAVNAGRGYRNPIPFELYGFGVHEGAGFFQVGDPNLDPETSFDTDASLRWVSSKFQAEVGVYRNYLSDFIYGNPTGYNFLLSGANAGSFCGPGIPGSLPNAGSCSAPANAGQGILPVEQSAQADATFWGGDLGASYALTNWLSIRGGFNLVRAQNDATGEWLPHIPADNGRIGFELHEKSLAWFSNPYFSADMRGYWAQNRTPDVPAGVSSPNPDTPTPGYVLFGMKTGTELVVAGQRLTYDMGVDNLLNKDYIDYTSILKEYNIANMGRNVYMRVSVPFGS